MLEIVDIRCVPSFKFGIRNVRVRAEAWRQGLSFVFLFVCLFIHLNSRFLLTILTDTAQPANFSVLPSSVRLSRTDCALSLLYRPPRYLAYLYHSADMSYGQFSMDPHDTPLMTSRRPGRSRRRWGISTRIPPTARHSKSATAAYQPDQDYEPSRKL